DIQEKKHPVQLARVSPKQPEQVPEKKRARRKREKQQIRHLRCHAGCVIGCGFPNQPAGNAPNESEIFHLGRSLLCGAQISIKVRSEEHTSELQSRGHLVCRLLLEK